MHGPPTGLVFAIYYPILAAIGIPANLVVILILSRRACGLSKCIIYYLVSLAVTDLLVMVTAVILNQIAGIYFPSSFLSITPVCSVRSALNFATIESSAWLTVAFTFDRCVAICWQKLKVKYCTEKMAAWVIGIVLTLSCVKNIFTYFAYKPVYIMNAIPWFCGLKDSYYTSPAWAAYDWLYSIINPILPFILILLLNALTIRHILAANRSRKRLRIQNKGEDQSDPEVEKRRKSIILLFAISSSFILLNLVFFVTIVYDRIANLIYSTGSAFNNSIFVLQQSGTMFQLLSSGINPFIYAGAHSKIRAELNTGMKYALSLHVKIFKVWK